MEFKIGDIVNIVGQDDTWKVHQILGRSWYTIVKPVDESNWIDCQAAQYHESRLQLDVSQTRNQKLDELMNPK